MKFTLETPVFKPVCITLESQEEIDRLVSALYHIKTDEFLDENDIEAIRNLRIELYTFCSEAKSS